MIWGILTFLFFFVGLIVYDLEKQIKNYSKKNSQEKKD